MANAYWLIGIAACSMGTSSVRANDRTEIMTVVRQMLGGFSDGRRAALATCADDTSILDSIAPMEWHGHGACERWFAAYDEELRSGEMTEPRVSLGTPRSFLVTADTAYLIAPMRFTYKQRGKLKKDTGGSVIITFKKETAGWRITGMAWPP